MPVVEFYVPDWEELDQGEEFTPSHTQYHHCEISLRRLLASAFDAMDELRLSASYLGDDPDTHEHLMKAIQMIGETAASFSEAGRTCIVERDQVVYRKKEEHLSARWLKAVTSAEQLLPGVAVLPLAEKRLLFMWITGMLQGNPGYEVHLSSGRVEVQFPRPASATVVLGPNA